ncbi:hypothetical protein HG530_002444 [Fusarium avenaceum]|nr:hypothetical protein HG530_002444 [Fusarium avenaceum]
MQDLASCPSAFVERKKKILEQLAIPDTEYTDASPKGSVDEGIRDLIDEINQQSGFVTTSSCAGRVSVFLEGRRVAEVEGEDEQIAGVGGKGAGGTWLFVSHDPVPDTGDKNTDWSSMFGLEDSTLAQETIGVVKERRLVHFKFEAMILHVLTASPEHAQILLRCGLQAGFRESGALNIIPSGKDAVTPMVAIRTMGLVFESLIGQQVDGHRQRIVSPEYLQTLVQIANERFAENKKRIERFQNAFRDAVSAPAPRRNPEGQKWEDAAARRERKRAEGLRKKAEMKAKQEADTSKEDDGLTNNRSPFPLQVFPTTLRLRDNLLNPGLLQLLDLGLEALNLLPTVERPSVVLPQTSDDLVARTFDLLTHSLNFLADGVLACAVVVLEFGVGKLLVCGLESFGFFLLKLLELLGHAGLNLELDYLGSRGICLPREEELRVSFGQGLAALVVINAD